MDNLVFFCKECKKEVKEEQVVSLCSDVTRSDFEGYTELLDGGKTIYVICKVHGS